MHMTVQDIVLTLNKIFRGDLRLQNAHHNLATPVEHPSRAGFTHTVTVCSFVFSSFQISTGDVCSSSSDARTSFGMV
jgi:hypothetical protein